MPINGRCQNVAQRVSSGGFNAYTLTERERENEGWVTVRGTTLIERWGGSQKIYLPEGSQAGPARPSGGCMLAAR